MYRYQLYESKTNFYIIKENRVKNEYNLLKINKSTVGLAIEGSYTTAFTAHQVQDIINNLSAGNKSNGGLKLVIKEFYGIFGFVTFTTGGYFMILITKRSPVSLIGGHYIYHIDDTVMISIPDAVGTFTSSVQSFSSLTAAIASTITNTLFHATSTKPSPSIIEQRYLQIFSHMDTTKNFYFSYSYNITQTLQYNMTTPILESSNNSMFVWNHYLLEGHLDPKSDWYLPAIYGFVDQSKISVYGHNLMVTLIARRSRFFAGARFLKRGVSDQGYVANDVETEQILNDASTTFFTLPVSKYSCNPGYTSFVQHRGSIPLYWSQEGLMAAKPSIEIDKIDPFYVAAAYHFNDLLNRYGSPITILNLVKSKEKTKREGILLEEFAKCVEYLNQFLPSEHKMRYIAYDMAGASKTNGEDVVGMLETIGTRFIEECGFFHSGSRLDQITNKNYSANLLGFQLQKGVLRTNCIDCLDRTNAAQFVAGKQALTYQLYALGIIPAPHSKYFAFDSEACDMFNAMYHDHGDTIALQYGGSHLVNTMETYRKVRGSSGETQSGVSFISHSRDTIETIKRYYSNSFTDAEKQDAINLFLGLFRPSKSNKFEKASPSTESSLSPKESPELWDLPTDFYLHNHHPVDQQPVSSYIRWFDKRIKSVNCMEKYGPLLQERIEKDKEAFKEYYVPSVYTSLASLYAFRMISTKSNVAAFEARINHTQKSLIIYNLNIGGVKQWNFLKPVMHSIADDDSKMEIDKEKDWKMSDPHGRITSTLDSPQSTIFVPHVKEKEITEYGHYYNQFRSVEIDPITAQPRTEEGEWPGISQYSSSNIEDHPDFKVFTSFIDVPIDISHLTIDSKSEQLYNNFLSISTDNFIGIKHKHADVALAQSYHFYLENGVFPSKSKH